MWIRTMHKSLLEHSLKKCSILYPRYDLLGNLIVNVPFRKNISLATFVDISTNWDLQARLWPCPIWHMNVKDVGKATRCHTFQKRTVLSSLPLSGRPLVKVQADAETPPNTTLGHCVESVASCLSHCSSYWIWSLGVFHHLSISFNV